MRKALNPTAWDASNVNPASNWPTNVEPMQVTKPASSPADEAGPLGARNSWLVDLGTGVQGRKARQGQFIQTTNFVRVAAGKLKDLGTQLAVDARHAPETGANAWFLRVQA